MGPQVLRFSGFARHLNEKDLCVATVLLWQKQFLAVHIAWRVDAPVAISWVPLLQLPRLSTILSVWLTSYCGALFNNPNIVFESHRIISYQSGLQGWYRLRLRCPEDTSVTLEILLQKERLMEVETQVSRLHVIGYFLMDDVEYTNRPKYYTVRLLQQIPAGPTYVCWKAVHRFLLRKLLVKKFWEYSHDIDNPLSTANLFLLPTFSIRGLQTRPTTSRKHQPIVPTPILIWLFFMESRQKSLFNQLPSVVKVVKISLEVSSPAAQARPLLRSGQIVMETTSSWSMFNLLPCGQLHASTGHHVGPKYPFHAALDAYAYHCLLNSLQFRHCIYPHCILLCSTRLTVQALLFRHSFLTSDFTFSYTSNMLPK